MARGDADTRLADHNWKAEHIVPSSQGTVAKALQVNLASVGDEEDDLVDVLAIGTRVTRYPDVKGAISAFNVGRGKFVDPLYMETMAVNSPRRQSALTSTARTPSPLTTDDRYVSPAQTSILNGKSRALLSKWSLIQSVF
jgi:hypothetical protein